MAKLPRYQRLGVEPAKPPQFDYANLREGVRLGQTISQQVDRMSSFLYRQEAAEAERRGIARVDEAGAEQTLAQLAAAGGPTNIEERAAFDAANKVFETQLRTETEIALDRIYNDGLRNNTPVAEVELQVQNLVSSLSERAKGLRLNERTALQSRIQTFVANESQKYQNSALNTSNRILGAEIETEAKLEVARIISAAEVNKTPFSEVQEQLQDVVDGFPAALSELDPATAGILRTRLGGIASEAEIRYGAFWTKYSGNQLQGRMLETMAVDSADIRQHAQDENATPESVEANIQATAQKMRDLQFGEDEISRFIIGIRENAAKDGTIAEFQRLTTLDEKQDFIQNLRDNPIDVLGKTGTNTLIRSLQTEVNNEINVNTRTATALEGDIKAARKIMTAGGDPGEEALLKLEARAQSLGEFGAGAGQMMANLRVERDVLLQFRRMAPGELQNTLNSMANGMEGIGGEGIDTQLEADILNSGRALLRTMNERTQSDPLSFAAQAGHIRFTPLDIMSGDANAAASIAERRDQARTAAAIYGVEPKFLTNEEASVFANLLKTSDRLARMQFLTSVAQHFGNDAPDVLAQVAPKNPELGHIGGLLLLGRTEAANEALEGMDLIKQGNKAVNFTPTNTQPVFSTAVGSALVYQSEARAAAFAVAEAIYTSRSFDKGLDDFDEGLYLDSINLAFGYNAQTGKGGLQSVRDYTVLAPSQLDGEDLNDMLEAFTPESLAANTGQDINPALAESIAENERFYLAVVEEGKYYIVAGEPGSDQFRYVTDTSGNAIIVDALKYYGYRE